MMSKMHRTKGMLGALVAAWALAACGGGGSGNGTTSSAASATPATGVAGTDAAAPALSGNVATDGRNWINYRRSQIGLPTLEHNTIIDSAAQGHSDYQRINNTVTHDQQAGKQGFTGAALADRMRAAGYTFTGSNAIGEVIAASSRQNGFTMAEELVTAIYHRFVMFEPQFKEIGSGAAATSAGYNYLTADFAANNGLGSGLAAGALAAWPFNGQTQVQVNFLSDSEEPDPVPDRNEVGYPISLQTNLSNVIAVQSFTVRPRGATTDLATRQVDNQVASSNPLQRHNLSAVAIIPLAPLAAATIYDVTFIGTLNGAAVGKTWSFTTK
ncbi:CAP domain-containing protein [Massilia forsythiae]|nr:CAP domain-containing protein [Massilia forsythiae]